MRAAVEAALLAGYRFRDTSTAHPQRLAEVSLVATDAADPGVASAIRDGQVSGEAVAWARDLINTPSNTKNPAWLADQVTARFAGLAHTTVTVLGPDELRAGGFGGVLAVGGGSATPPRVVVVSYRPPSAGSAHPVLVGKGITFDTGGISIKPNAGMREMKTDMAGGAAVLATLDAVARLELPVAVTAVVPMAENAVSGSSYRPADVVRHVGGRTTEVLNTDAEGRMVLADGLAYARLELGATVLVDVATLTGAMKVALGTKTAGLFATSDGLADALVTAGARTGEALWRMPLADEYTDLLDSTVADANNAPGGPGGTTAALFLRPFAGELPWAHLDVAGPARAGADDGEIVKGGTGFGARTLLRWLEAGAPVEGTGDRPGLTSTQLGRYSPTVPSIASRSRSACPAWRAVSSSMWIRIQRRSQCDPSRDVPARAGPGPRLAPPPPGCARMRRGTAAAAPRARGRPPSGIRSPDRRPSRDRPRVGPPAAPRTGGGTTSPRPGRDG